MDRNTIALLKSRILIKVNIQKLLPIDRPIVVQVKLINYSSKLFLLQVYSKQPRYPLNLQYPLARLEKYRTLQESSAVQSPAPSFLSRIYYLLPLTGGTRSDISKGGVNRFC